MGETYAENPNAILNAIRSFFGLLDRAAYGLLMLVYQLFFNVASADIFSSGTITRFYARVQVIIGVFMMFQLAMTILKGIVNPDSFVDAKSGGLNLIIRICTSLFMLALVIPIGTSGSNEYERQINNNGLLFGTLYSLQNRVLSNNTIGRLVLGTKEDESNYMSSSTSTDDLEKSARIFTSTILKGFYRINLIPESDRDPNDNPNNKEPEMVNAYRMCQDIPDDIKDEYTKIDADPFQIISYVNEQCNNNIFNSKLIASISGSGRYIFVYSPFISTIVGFLFVVIMLGFTIDVAVRAIKLAVLRLIAPIPIISYMDPKGSKDGAFNAWVKTLTSTYLDLFIRVAVIYFVIFIIQEIITNGIAMNQSSGVLKVFTIILIFIGLFMFAKQAPKFFREALGMKGDGGSIFGGLGEALAIGAAGAGIVGSAAANYRAAKAENDELHPDSKFNGLLNAGSAIAGAIGGGYVGMKAAAGKDASVKSVLNAQSQRNAQRAAHSTLLGRVGSDLYGAFTGRSLATRDQGILDANKAAASSIKAFKSTAVEEAMKKGDYGTVTAAHDRFGRLSGIQFNYRELEAAMSSKDTSGNFDYTDRSGHVHHLNSAWFDSGVMSDIEDSQTASYLRSDYDPATGAFRNGKINTDWRNARHDMGEAGLSYTGDYLGDIGANPSAYGDIGKTIGDANQRVADMSTNMRSIMNRANSQGKK